ncbi:MAG: Holliday junction resolvase RuvX [Pyrinomonadaceae bacterium]|nr:Holliday junction resolvase RuvX [Pyrinomonadaceae bacterium]
MTKLSGRILSVDLGKKRVGIAVCDELQMTTRGVAVLQMKTTAQLLTEIEKFIADFDAVAVVIGLPLNFDGSESANSTEARKIAAEFEKSITIPIYLQDERLTSHEAEEILREQGFNQTEIKKRVDMEAAAVILRDYLSN